MSDASLQDTLGIRVPRELAQQKCAPDVFQCGIHRINQQLHDDWLMRPERTRPRPGFRYKIVCRFGDPLLIECLRFRRGRQCPNERGKPPNLSLHLQSCGRGVSHRRDLARRAAQAMVRH